MVTAAKQNAIFPGQRIRLVIEAMDGERVHTTVIDDVQGDEVRVQTPIEKRELVHLRMGTRLKAFVRVGRDAYAFETTVNGSIAGRVHLTRLAAPQSIQKIEQRSFYRLQRSMVPVKTEVWAADGTTRDFKATVMDISGGGIAFNSTDTVPVGQRVRMVLGLQPFGQIDVFVRVLARDEPASGQTNYRYHCQFIDLQEADRERVIRFVFQNQRWQIQQAGG